MGRIGIISTIKKEFSDSSVQTMNTALSRKGLTRVPGTGVFKFPYKEIDGKYRTGLDENASYIKRIPDPTERELEIERVTKLKEKLSNALGGIDLGPRAPFWNYALSTGSSDQTHVQAVKLIDGDNHFDLDSTFQELTFSWLRVHPTIASSEEAWNRGEFPADTQFYVVDKQKENALKYKKKQIINKAIVKLDSMIPTRIKVARLLGLPVIDNTPEEFVYNEIDNVLKQTEFKKGKFKGMDPVRVFTQFADMNDSLFHIKDVVKQAVAHSIYRINASGRVYEGELELAASEEDLVKSLANEDNQEELIILEDKLKTKKLAAV